jgi:phage terminase large subunit-like protein
VRCYVPEAQVVPRSERGNVPYQTWAQTLDPYGQPWLTVTPGDIVDYAYIERDVIASLDRFAVRQIGFDKWNAWDLVNRLTEQGAPMVEFRQGPQSFNGPMKEMERLLASRTLDHGSNPVLSWAASNIVARKDVNENMAPDRKNSQEKIDPIVAVLMGLGLSIHAEQPTEPQIIAL